MAEENLIAGEFVKVRLLNRFGDFLTHVKELPLKAPVELLKIEALEVDGSRPFVFVLVATITGLDKVVMWPFQSLMRDSTLCLLTDVLDNLIIDSARPGGSARGQDEDRFLRLSRFIQQCRERIEDDSRLPNSAANEIDPETVVATDRYSLDYGRIRTVSPEQTHTRTLTQFLADESAVLDGPEEYHFHTPAAVLDDIEGHLRSFNADAVERNSLFIEKYHNLFFALKVLVWLETSIARAGGAVPVNDCVLWAIAQACNLEALSPSELYRVLYELNRE